MDRSQFILFIACALFSLASGQYGGAQTFTYKTVGNLNIQLDVYLPAESSYDKYPVFFCIHGGAYVEGAKSDGASGLELFEMLSLGFAVVSIDYRLSPGVLLPDIVQDVQDAYNYVRTNLTQNISINPDAIVVWGRSAGGGLSVISGYMLSPRPKAVIAFYPYCTNFTDSYAYDPSTPVGPIIIAEANLLRKPVLTEFINPGGVDPHDVLFKTALAAGKVGWLYTTTNATESSDVIYGILKQYSVVDNLDQNYPPTYLIHGLADTLVPYDQSVMMANVLNATNIDYVLDLVPGVNHAFDESISSATDPTWQQYILPLFSWVEGIIQKDLEIESIIS